MSLLHSFHFTLARFNSRLYWILLSPIFLSSFPIFLSSTFSLSSLLSSSLFLFLMPPSVHGVRRGTGYHKARNGTSGHDLLGKNDLIINDVSIQRIALVGDRPRAVSTRRDASRRPSSGGIGLSIPAAVLNCCTWSVSGPFNVLHALSLSRSSPALLSLDR